ncbi:ABC transporter ATP-binding protein, partial [candidate division KSB1 bacterium]|nr:ABC transporter ATP-binding protein [candidate division KSB1 bacterium]
ILDEPTIGLDPKQIIEVRQLIKSLAGSHTIILSTHILPEVSMTCERVVIIDKGKVVAEDTPDNLKKKLTGSMRLHVAIKGKVADIQSRLSKVAGVQKVERMDTVEVDGVNEYLVDGSADAEIRPQLAKAVIDNGWELYEMKPEGMSLEDVFLHVTTEEEVGAQ